MQRHPQAHVLHLIAEGVPVTYNDVPLGPQSALFAIASGSAVAPKPETTTHGPLNAMFGRLLKRDAKPHEADAFMGFLRDIGFSAENAETIRDALDEFSKKGS